MRRLFVLFAILLCARSVFAACGTTTWTPRRNENPNCHLPEFATTPATHKALWLMDPAGEQVAVVDLEWGGVLVSLQYQGVEHFWGHDTGATVQPAMFHGASYTYNPQQAGDWGERTYGKYSRGAPLYGFACKDNSRIVLYTAAIDDAQDNRGFYGRAAGIRSEQVAPKMWFTPYAFTTNLTFVPSGNPAGTGPQYYLKMEQAVLNTDSTEGANMNKVFGFGLEMAMYTRGVTPSEPSYWNWACQIEVGSLPGSFRYHDFSFGDCTAMPCGEKPAASITKMMTGGYADSARTIGVASMTNPAAHHATWPDPVANVVIGRPEFDKFWNNSAVHAAFNYLILKPLQGRRYVYYFLAGPAARAKLFNPQ